jgi:curved DNA-binding protein CbpA
MDPQDFRQRIGQIYRDLERYTYYELLNLRPDADLPGIRQAFHRLALTLHPDRYQTHPDPVLRQQVYAIYKRMTEAYRVLTSREGRVLYDSSLATGKRRLMERERRMSALYQAEQAIADPQARKFFLLARDSEHRGDLKGARINYKFARDLVGDHPEIVKRLQALDERESH